MKIYNIDITKDSQQHLWCYCVEFPDAYGVYRTIPEAEQDLRYQIKLSLMDKIDDVPEEDFLLNFVQ